LAYGWLAPIVNEAHYLPKKKKKKKKKDRCTAGGMSRKPVLDAVLYVRNDPQRLRQQRIILRWLSFSSPRLIKLQHGSGSRFRCHSAAGTPSSTLAKWNRKATHCSDAVAA
jgi:hypothetical protein